MSDGLQGIPEPRDRPPQPAAPPPEPGSPAEAGRAIVDAFDAYMTPITGDEGGAWRDLKQAIESMRRALPPGQEK